MWELSQCDSVDLVSQPGWLLKKFEDEIERKKKDEIQNNKKKTRGLNMSRKEYVSLSWISFHESDVSCHRIC